MLVIIPDYIISMLVIKFRFQISEIFDDLNLRSMLCGYLALQSGMRQDQQYHNFKNIYLCFTRLELDGNTIVNYNNPITIYHYLNSFQNSKPGCGHYNLHSFID